MDERVHLARKPGGATEFRINDADLEAIGGRDALLAEIESRGVERHHLGEPVPSKSRPRIWTIPVRKENDD